MTSLYFATRSLEMKENVCLSQQGIIIFQWSINYYFKGTSFDYIMFSDKFV